MKQWQSFSVQVHELAEKLLLKQLEFSIARLSWDAYSFIGISALIGTMNWTSTKMKGSFDCPQCGQLTDFRLRESRPFLTFYLVPIVPIGGLTVFVQCNQCKESYEPSVLSISRNAIASANSQEQAFENDLLTAIALCLSADEIHESEIWISQRVYQSITQKRLTRSQLGAACSQTRTARLSTSSFFVTASQRRAYEERLQIAQAMFSVAAAEGKISSERMQTLVGLPESLGLAQREFRECIADAGTLV